MESYVSFPVWIVLLANLLAISTYAIGAYILAGFGVILPLLCLAYCRLSRRSRRQRGILRRRATDPGH